jgi:hypothetical protein
VLVQGDIVGSKREDQASTGVGSEAALNFSLPTLVDQLGGVAPDTKVVAGDCWAMGHDLGADSTDPAEAAGVAGAVDEGITNKE